MNRLRLSLKFSLILCVYCIFCVSGCNWLKAHKDDSQNITLNPDNKTKEENPGEDKDGSKEPESETDKSTNTKVPYTPISEGKYLRKLSLHIKGILPSFEEYDSLALAIQTQTTAKFLSEKRSEYLSSQHHSEKMNQRLNELFRFKPESYLETPEWPITKTEHDNYGPGYESNNNRYQKENSANELFRRIIRENQSWDQLLLNKSYHVLNFRKNRKNLFTDFLLDEDFYKPIAKNEMAQVTNDFWDLGFSADDDRIGGVLTTSRFFSRYPTTAINKNRKRSAAIFRIFLCDTMNAVAIDSSQNEADIFKKVFPNIDSTPTPNAGSNIDLSGKPEKRHDEDPACAKCHYKLDPMGRTFVGSTLYLSPKPNPGALVYKIENHEKLELPVRGIGSLAKRIVEQNEYLNCQMQHFWNWFVGEEIPLTPVRLKELVEDFQKNDRRVNDFISILTDSPEFWSQSQDSNGTSFEREVKNILKRCDSCHKEEDAIPSFADWPIGGTPLKMELYIEKISKALSFETEGVGAKMPPKKSDWKLSLREVKILQQWLQIN